MMAEQGQAARRTRQPTPPPRITVTLIAGPHDPEVARKIAKILMDWAARNPEALEAYRNGQPYRGSYH